MLYDTRFALLTRFHMPGMGKSCPAVNTAALLQAGEAVFNTRRIECNILQNYFRLFPVTLSRAAYQFCAVLLISMVLLKSFVRPVMTGWLGVHWGKLAFSMIHAFYYIALIAEGFCRPRKRDAARQPFLIIGNHCKLSEKFSMN